MVLSGSISISITITKPSIPVASLSPNSSHSSPPRKPSKVTSPKLDQTQQNQPSVAAIERAIGAGIYRDHDPSGTSDPAENNVFDTVLSNSIGRTEGKTERMLRETGEWISEQTEKSARSSGKKVLEVMFFWIAPAWFLLLLVATGAIKLPSSLSSLEDLIM